MPGQNRIVWTKSRLGGNGKKAMQVHRWLRRARDLVGGARRAVVNALGPAEAIVPGPIIDTVSVLRRHKQKFGSFPNIVRPKMFNEKVIWRMLFDHREIWTQLQDKYAAREYIARRIGANVQPTLYWVASDAADIPIDDLPQQFMVKPTHGSGWVYPVRDKASLDWPGLVETCASWLRRNYYHVDREWVYKDIEPRIIVEELVDDGRGASPTDYKVFVFDGHVHVIQVTTGIFGDHRRTFFDRDWNKINAVADFGNADGEMDRPWHLDEMLAYAEAVGEGLDFIRADFYDTPTRVYLGELTTTPGGGMNAYRPPEFARYMGDLWTLPSLRATRCRRLVRHAAS